MQNTAAARQKLADIRRALGLFKSGRFENARVVSENLLTRYPREPLLYNILGGVQVENGMWRPAEKYFAKAAKLAPKNFEFLRNLARAQMMLHNEQAAERNLVRAVQLNPDFAEGWNTLGLVYLEKDDREKAYKAFSRALRIKPAFAEAAANVLIENERANGLEKLKESLESFNTHLGDNPVSTMCRGLIAEREKDYETARKFLSEANFGADGVLENTTLEAMRLERLAKVNDKLGNYKEAYDLFLLSNQHVFNSSAKDTFSGKRFRAHTQERDAYFSDFKPEQWADIDTLDDEPVFMVGFPRSGTTLLDTFLRGHKDIMVTEELPMVKGLMNDIGTKDLGQIDRLDTLSSMKATKAGHNYLKELRKNAGDSAVRVDRMPFNILRIGEILRVFPKAKFILALRDPADVVFSCFMQNFSMNDSNATFLTPEDAARTYDETFNLWQTYLEKMDFPYFILRYEDVVDDAESTLRPLVDFLGLEWDPAMLDHQKTANDRERIKTASYAQVVQPIYKTALKRWEHYADLMPEAVEKLKPWRAYFGYSDS